MLINENRCANRTRLIVNNSSAIARARFRDCSRCIWDTLERVSAIESPQNRTTRFFDRCARPSFSTLTSFPLSESLSLLFRDQTLIADSQSRDSSLTVASYALSLAGTAPYVFHSYLPSRAMKLDRLAIDSLAVYKYRAFPLFTIQEADKRAMVLIAGHQSTCRRRMAGAPDNCAAIRIRSLDLERSYSLDCVTMRPSPIGQWSLSLSLSRARARVSMTKSCSKICSQPRYAARLFSANTAVAVMRQLC